MTMPSRTSATCSVASIALLEPLEDVLPADHLHRVDARVEQRRDRLADRAVAVVLEAVDLDDVVRDVVEGPHPRHRLRRPARVASRRIAASCCACSIGASIL